MLTRSLFTVLLQDLLGLRSNVRQNRYHIESALKWLMRAQDVSGGGGVSVGYSFIKGWLPDYIETTGYTISTLLESSLFFKDSLLIKRAKKMANFLVNMQLNNGGYRTYPPSQVKDSRPTIFNTAQDLIGMADIYRATFNKIYLKSLIQAANFLVRFQNKDGSWTKYSYDGLSHSYDTRVAFALIKAYMVSKNSNYLASANKNLEWALSLQNRNGWFINAQLPPPNPKVPYTHTIAYTIEGFLLSGLVLDEEKYILVAKKTADAILEYYFKNNYLPGTMDSNWNSSDKYSCLVGDAQLSGIWLRLYLTNGDLKYLNGAKKLNYYLKSCQTSDTKDIHIRGGIKGSQPIYGDILKGRGYSRLTYINWAAKYFIDSLLLEEIVTNNKKPQFI